MVQTQQKRVQKRKVAELAELETPVVLKNTTKQNQITEEKQSFALVQTLLLASVSIWNEQKRLFFSDSAHH
jgi:hypothetical protein